MSIVPGKARRALDPREMDIQMVANHHVGAGNKTKTFWKIRQWLSNVCFFRKGFLVSQLWLFWNSLYRTGWPLTHKRATCLCLPTSEIKGMYHHSRSPFFFFFKVSVCVCVHTHARESAHGGLRLTLGTFLDHSSPDSLRQCLSILCTALLWLV